MGNQWQRGIYLLMFPVDGVILHKRLAFRSHISAVYSIGFFHHIRDLRRISSYLHLNDAKLLANALVSSHLDYCNSPLCLVLQTLTSPNFNVFRIDLLRVVRKSPSFKRSVSLLCSLQWLPVQLRVDFKICLLTYMTLREKHPVYILTPCFPHHSHPGHWNQIKESQGFFRLVTLLFGTSARYLFAQPPQVKYPGNVSKHISLTWPFPP